MDEFQAQLGLVTLENVLADSLIIRSFLFAAQKMLHLLNLLLRDLYYVLIVITSLILLI